MLAFIYQLPLTHTYIMSLLRHTHNLSGSITSYSRCLPQISTLMSQVRVTEALALAKSTMFPSSAELTPEESEQLQTVRGFIFIYVITCRLLIVLVCAEAQ